MRISLVFILCIAPLFTHADYKKQRQIASAIDRSTNEKDNLEEKVAAQLFRPQVLQAEFKKLRWIGEFKAMDKK